MHPLLTTKLNNLTLRHAIKDYLSSNVKDKRFIIYKYGEIGDWDVSNVTYMESMFEGARSFNQPLNNWNVSNVTNMLGMFSFASSFNQPLNKWNVSNVRVMCGMFWNARSFNQPLNNWDVSNETDMERMFRGASSFNQPLHAPWYVVQPWVEQSESE